MNYTNKSQDEIKFTHTEMFYQNLFDEFFEMIEEIKSSKFNLRKPFNQVKKFVNFYSFYLKRGGADIQKLSTEIKQDENYFDQLIKIDRIRSRGEEDWMIFINCIGDNEINMLKDFCENYYIIIEKIRKITFYLKKVGIFPTFYSDVMTNVIQVANRRTFFSKTSIARKHVMDVKQMNDLLPSMRHYNCMIYFFEAYFGEDDEVRDIKEKINLRKLLEPDVRAAIAQAIEHNNWKNFRKIFLKDYIQAVKAWEKFSSRKAAEVGLTPKIKEKVRWDPLNW